MNEANVSISTFGSIVKRAREDLQRQADKVTHLQVNNNDNDYVYDKVFEDINFSNLESISFDATDHKVEALLERYIEPKLRRLQFHGGLFSDAVLISLQVYYPLLEELTVENGRFIFSQMRFLRFLDSMGSLKILSLMNGTYAVGINHIFVALATKPNLEVLEFERTITARLVSEAFEKQILNDSGGMLFPKLRKLVCVGEPSGLRRLSPYLLQLTHLEANIKCDRAGSAEAQDSVVHSIAICCPNLYTLKLRYLGPKVAVIPSQALVNLAQGNSQLKTLRIADAKVEDFYDPHFIGMVRALPRVEHLSLRFQCHLTAASLIAAARNCGTTLVEFEIEADIDLRNETQTDVSFSELTSFTVGKFAHSDPFKTRITEAEVSNKAQFLKALAPKLTHFSSILNSAVTGRIIDEVLK
ncbi:hypothetical protein F5Y04DRAFT_289078 [Hypomontagnella monticulosa]|nr:hypothetical protein F5Y04DRAFT_289078 [Hypomontagnella monticulosa]